MAYEYYLKAKFRRAEGKLMEVIVIILISLAAIYYWLSDNSSYQPSSTFDEISEEEISPMTEFLIFEDFMEDGDLDDF